MKRLVLGLMIMFFFTSCSARNNEDNSVNISTSNADETISTPITDENPPFTIDTAIEDGLRMSERCTTAFRTRRNCRKRVTTCSR